MPGWKAKNIAVDLAPLLAELLADKLTKHLRPVLLMGDDCVVSEAEAGQILTSSKRTLEYWRAHGIGPRSVKVGERRIAYRVGELRAYIRDAERGPTR